MIEQLPDSLSDPIRDIEARIKATLPDERDDLQAGLHRLCHCLESQGYEVPERLRLLDRLLTDAMTEAQFDNMPV